MALLVMDRQQKHLCLGFVCVYVPMCAGVPVCAGVPYHVCVYVCVCTVRAARLYRSYPQRRWLCVYVRVCVCSCVCINAQVRNMMDVRRLLLQAEAILRACEDGTGMHTAAADILHLSACTVVWFTAERNYKSEFA